MTRLATSTPDGVADESSTLKASGTVAVWTMASRFVGLLRVGAIGAILGPTYLGNLFQIVNLLPWFLYDLAVGSLLTSVVVPPLVAANAKADGSFSVVASAFLTAVVAAFGAVMVVFLIAAPVTADILGLGLVSDAPREAYVSAAVPLLVLTAPQILGYGVIALLVGVQNARGSFALSAAAPLVESAVVVATLGLFAIVYGFGVSVTDVSRSGLLLLGGGSTLGVVLHVMVQLIGSRRVGARLRFGSLAHSSVRTARGMASSAAAASAMNGARMFLPLYVTGAVAGGAVIFQLAHSILAVAHALVARSIGSALQPRAAALATSFRWSDFGHEYLQAQSLTVLFALPASVGMLVLAPWLAAGLAFGEMQTAVGLELMTAAIASVSGAVLGSAVIHVAVSTSFARSRGGLAVREMGLRLVLTVIGLGVAWMTLSGTALMVAVGLTVTGSSLVSAAIGWNDPIRGIAVPRSSAFASARRTMLACGVMVPFSVLTWTARTDIGAPPLATATVAIAVAGLGAGFLATRYVLAPEEVTSLGRSLSQRASA